MKDYYEILGVERTASQDDIKRAYRKLAFLHHPDVGGTKEKFQEIGEAYGVLKDEAKRKNYDEVGHENYAHEHSSGASPSAEELFKQWFDKNVSTETSVDAFTPGYPSIFMGSAEWEDLHTGDIPWSAMDIRIMKWERASTMLDEQVKYLSEHLGDLVDSSYAKLLSPEKLLRLAFGLKKDNWLRQEEYEKVIELVDEYDVEREKFMREREGQEKQLEQMEPFLDLEEELRTRPFTKEENDRAVAAYYKRMGSGSYLEYHNRTKDNEEVKKIKEEEGSRKASWKEGDMRKQWRREVGKLR